MSELTDRLRGQYQAGDSEVTVKRDFSAFIPAISLEAANKIDELQAEIERLSNPTRISPREKFLMKEYARAAEYYKDMDSWLTEVISDGGHTVEMALNHDANEISPIPEIKE